MAPLPQGEQHNTEHPAGATREAGPRPVAYIDQARCDRSPGCPVMRICPKRAVVPDEAAAVPDEGRSLRSLLGLGGPHGGWMVDESKCTGCLLCAQYCPHGAVQGRERRVA